MCLVYIKTLISISFNNLELKLNKKATQITQHGRKHRAHSATAGNRQLELKKLSRQKLLRRGNDEQNGNLKSTLPLEGRPNFDNAQVKHLSWNGEVLARGQPSRGIELLKPFGGEEVVSGEGVCRRRQVHAGV